MTAKQIAFSRSARHAILDGVNYLANAVKEGERILFGKYSGTEVKLDGVEHVILTEDDVLAVLS